MLYMKKDLIDTQISWQFRSAFTSLNLLHIRYLTSRIKNDDEILKMNNVSYSPEIKRL